MALFAGYLERSDEVDRRVVCDFYIVADDSAKNDPLPTIAVKADPSDRCCLKTAGSC